MSNAPEASVGGATAPNPEALPSLTVTIPSNIHKDVSRLLLEQSETVLKEAAKIKAFVGDDGGTPFEPGPLANLTDDLTDHLPVLKAQWVDLRFLAYNLFPLGSPDTRETLDANWSNYLDIAVRALQRDNPLYQPSVESHRERGALLTRERPAAPVYTFPAYTPPSPGVSKEAHLDALYGEHAPAITALFAAPRGGFTGIGTSPLAVEGLTVNEVETVTRWLEMKSRINTAVDAQENPMDYGFTPSEIEVMANNVERWTAQYEGMKAGAEPIVDRMRDNVRKEDKRVAQEQRLFIIPDLSGVTARAAVILPTIRHYRAEEQALVQAVFEEANLPAGHFVYDTVNELAKRVDPSALSGLKLGQAQDALSWIFRLEALEPMMEDAGLEAYQVTLPLMKAEHAADMIGRLAAAQIGAYTYSEASLYNNCPDGKAPSPEEIATFEALVIHPVRLGDDGDYVRCAEDDVSGPGQWSVYARRRAPDVGEVCITDGPSTGDLLADKSAAVEVARHLARGWGLDLEYGPFSRNLEEDLAFGAVGVDQDRINSLSYIEVLPVSNTAGAGQPAEFLISSGHDAETYAVFGVTEDEFRSVLTVVPVGSAPWPIENDLGHSFSRATEIAQQISQKWDVPLVERPWQPAVQYDNRGMGM